MSNARSATYKKVQTIIKTHFSLEYQMQLCSTLEVIKNLSLAKWWGKKWTNDECKHNTWKWNKYNKIIEASFWCQIAWITMQYLFKLLLFYFTWKIKLKIQSNKNFAHALQFLILNYRLMHYCCSFILKVGIDNDPVRMRHRQCVGCHTRTSSCTVSQAADELVINALAIRITIKFRLGI